MVATPMYCKSARTRFAPNLILASVLGALAVQSVGLAQNVTQPGQAPASVATLQPINAVSQNDATSEGTGQYNVPVVSSATRLPLSPRETPQTINVVTRTQMDDFRLNNATSLLSAVPGVFVQQVETDRNYYIIRGYDVTNFQVDGVGMPFSTEEQIGDLDMAFYDRVEVLKGPMACCPIPVILQEPLISYASVPSVNFLPTRAYRIAPLPRVGSMWTYPRH